MPFCPLNPSARSEKIKYSLLSYGKNEKNECIRSSTMKQTKKNECICSSTIDVLTLLLLILPSPSILSHSLYLYKQGFGSALIKCGSGYQSGSSIFSYCGSGFQIRNPDPDPMFDDLKLKKIYSWKFNFYFLDQKLPFTYP
jgi:hypothetical protein